MGCCGRETSGEKAHLFPGEPLGRGEVGRRKSRSPNLESGFGEEGAALGAS